MREVPYETIKKSELGKNIPINYIRNCYKKNLSG